ncbi:iron complex transport system permease protein [Antricoccus suffuscus]|uniref:Iron complex transport system permease protein n=1 Tax=Antricoccus suffuscus TaxID=1629062 RepID=A0A2T0ZZ52_9ACTN|nr:iron chelate uptake ABC transporter family permease subunit [Antricoccus suffuscus]PRZ41517.1 iron complex transport system permease protein [Antricoccus suffuscus]
MTALDTHAESDAPPVSKVDFGRRTVRIKRGRLSMRFDLRVLVVCGLLAAVMVAMGLFALATGDYPLTVREVIGALTGQETGFTHIVVVEWRLPRVLAAIIFGAALGVAGAIFQTLTRNPLGSPDVIGFSTGAYTGALIVIIFVGGSYMQMAAGALVGGIATAGVVYLLAYKRGVQGFRLIIVGIAISAMLTSLNTWLLLTADLEVAMTGAAWGAGSLNGIGWTQAFPAIIVVVVLLACASLMARPMHQLELGDDASRALGLSAEPTRLGLVLVGVGLTASVTAAAGPIAFVALAAPQIARRLTRSAGVTLAPAAFTGAFLLVAADYIAQHLLRTVPVGVVTVCIGGIYLIWLLIHEARRRG